MPKTPFQEKLNQINDGAVKNYYRGLIHEIKNKVALIDTLELLNGPASAQIIQDNINQVYQLLQECSRTVDDYLEAKIECGEVNNAAKND